MRTTSPDHTVDELCKLFGKTRQAYYQLQNYHYKEAICSEVLVKKVLRIRSQMPRIGGRKLYEKIFPSLPNELQIGRDAFFNVLRYNNLLVRRKRTRAITTMSNHWLRKYPNLIREYEPTAPHQLWVSDITYVDTTEGFVYLSLITDAYSRKIVGWHIGESLETVHTLEALKMAIRQLPKGKRHNLIHHSDRGVQYCSYRYTKKLKRRKIKISMTENGDPLENAIAERVNGILKTEWLYDITVKDKQHAKREIKRIIHLYNYERPHLSIEMLTPDQAHNLNGELLRCWKNYYRTRKYDDEQEYEYKVMTSTVPVKTVTSGLPQAQHSPVLTGTS
ncbi:MAG: IS3 family transposase [Bacteroidales bacterium]|nr:IS3 family transposase [Bacteroidales bacterium]